MSRLKQYFFLSLRVLFLVFIFFYPWPYILETPGLAVALKDMVKVSGADWAGKPGELYLTTIFYERANLGFFLLSQLSPARELIPLPQEEQKDFALAQKFMDIQMRESKLFARIAALKYLGYPVDYQPEGIEIFTFLPESRARGILKEEDLILGAEGKSLLSSHQLAAFLAGFSPGSKVKLEVLRKGRLFQPEVPTISYQGRTIIGFQPLNRFKLGKMPREIEIESDGINGGSAGLMFALEIIRKLGKAPLTYEKVAGTGSISPDGKVGEIEGAEYKILAAQREKAGIFLIPREDFAELGDRHFKLKLIPVSTLKEAVEKLEQEVK